MIIKILPFSVVAFVIVICINKIPVDNKSQDHDKKKHLDEKSNK